jgi:hypothetical protein
MAGFGRYCFAGFLAVLGMLNTRHGSLLLHARGSVIPILRDSFYFYINSIQSIQDPADIKAYLPRIQTAFLSLPCSMPTNA